MHFATVHLAQAATDTQVSGNWVTGFIVAIIGAVAAALARHNGKAIGRAETQGMTVTNNPLDIRLDEGPLSRREFRLYRETTDGRLCQIEAAQLRASDNVERKHIELIATIERAAKIGVDGRLALWNHLKPLEKEVTILASNSNVAEQLAKLADTLKQNPLPYVCKTVSH